MTWLDYLKKYWYAIPVLIILYLLFFRKKRSTYRRRRVKKVAVIRRRTTSTKGTRYGSKEYWKKWGARMKRLKAKKARARK